MVKRLIIFLSKYKQIQNKIINKMQDDTTNIILNQTLSNELLHIANNPDPNIELPNDQYKFILCLLIAYPFGFLNHFIHGYYKRLIYSIFLGMSLQYYFFKSEMIQTLICLIVNCLIIKTCNRKKIGFYCTAFSFLHLSYLNLNILIFDYGAWKMDITTICMMNLCKHSAFAYNHQDALIETDEKKENESSLIKRRKIYAVKEFNFIEYIGYIYFYPTALMGPFFEYKDFADFIKEENDYKKIPKIKCLLSSLKSILYASLFGLIYLIFKNYSTVNFFFNNLNKDESLNLFNLVQFKNSKEISFFYKFLLYFLMLFQKYKYFVAFFLSEGACQASGISWNPSKNENNKIKNIEISVVENIFDINIGKYFQNWNISVHLWIKNYIFFRLYDDVNDYKNSAKIQKAKTVSFIVSAFWHGFYPCYYVVFGHFAICIQIESNLEFIKKNYPILVEKIEQAKLNKFIDNNLNQNKNVEENKKGNRSFYAFKYLDYAFSFIILSCMSYNYGIMESLSIKQTFTTMRNFYFIPSIIVIGLLKLSGKYAGIIKKKLKKFESQNIDSNKGLKKEN